MAACISTWTFGVDAARICSQNLAQKQSGLDSVENAIKGDEHVIAYSFYVTGLISSMQTVVVSVLSDNRDKHYDYVHQRGYHI